MTRFEKKTIIAAIAITSCFTGAEAETPVSGDNHFGVRASMEITSPGNSHSDYNNGAGFSVGGIYRFCLPHNFYFEPGLLGAYNTMGIKRPVELSEHFYEGTAKNFSFRIPLNIGYRIALLDNLGLDVFTGPWLNIGVTAKESITPNFEAPLPDPAIADNNLYKKGWKRFDAQWGFGLSITFAGCYHLGICGGVGISPLASYGNKTDKIKIRRNMFGISLGYNF